MGAVVAAADVASVEPEVAGAVLLVELCSNRCDNESQTFAIEGQETQDNARVVLVLYFSNS